MLLTVFKITSTNWSTLNIFLTYGSLHEHGSVLTSNWQSLWLVHEIYVDACGSCRVISCVIGTAPAYFPQLPNTIVSQPLKWVKFLEYGEAKHCPLVTTLK